MNQWPLDSILEMQKQNDRIWIDAPDLGPVFEKTKRALDELELAPVVVLALQLVRQDDKLPPLLPKVSPEMVINRHPIMHDPVGNQQYAFVQDHSRSTTIRGSSERLDHATNRYHSIDSSARCGSQ